MSTHLFCDDASGVYKAKPLLDTVGLNTKGFRKPYSLNKGQVQGSGRYLWFRENRTNPYTTFPLDCINSPHEASTCISDSSMAQ